MECPEAKSWVNFFYTLASKAPTLDSQVVCERAVGWMEKNLPDFFTHPASTKGEQHHNLICGLAQHTAEVLQIGVQTRAVMLLEDKIPYEQYFCAALYHDSGKVRAYEKSPGGGWVKTPASRLFHHIQLSMDIWWEMTGLTKLETDIDQIGHAILAHHGCREWGSPVTPATQLAHLLHLSDTMSARLSDPVFQNQVIDYRT